MGEKGWEERGPKAHSKNSDFLVAFQDIFPLKEGSEFGWRSKNTTA